MTSIDTYRYQLKWHSHSSHLNGSVAALLCSERFTDVVLCTMDGSQIPAHKFILSSYSMYLCNLFEGQRSENRVDGMLYVVLPSEISTKALKILVEYMYKGESTVSNEVLHTVLKAGEVLKIIGLFRQTEDGSKAPQDKTITTINKTMTANINKQVTQKKSDDGQPNLAIKKDDKLLKAFSPVQLAEITRPMFIRPPKLVFIKTADGTTQAALRPIAPKGQTILVVPTPASGGTTLTAPISMSSAASVTTLASTSATVDSSDVTPPPKILRRHAAEQKYGKIPRTETAPPEPEEVKESDEVQTENVSETSEKSSQSASESTTEAQVKDEPEWDAISIEEEERSIAEMFQAEINVKSEPIDKVEIEEDSLMRAWAREFGAAQTAAAGGRAPAPLAPGELPAHSDDGEETMAVVDSGLCREHFPTAGECAPHTHTGRDEATTSTSTGSRGPRGKNAHYYRDYRARKRDEQEKEALNTINVAGSATTKKRKSAAAYQREYRARKKAIRDKVLVESKDLPSTIYFDGGTYVLTHQSTTVDQQTTAGPSINPQTTSTLPTTVNVVDSPLENVIEKCDEL